MTQYKEMKIPPPKGMSPQCDKTSSSCSFLGVLHQNKIVTQQRTEIISSWAEVLNKEINYA